MASVAAEEFVESSAEPAAVRRSCRRRWALVFSASLGGIALSSLLGWFLWDREQTLTEMQFTLEAEERIASLQRTAADRLGALDMVAAFFAGSQLVEPQEFHTFTSPLMPRHRGMELLGWAPRIPAAQRQAHEQAVRKEGLVNYQIGQRDSQGQFVAAENRDEYYPLQFIEPLSQGQSLLGFDLASNPACRRAIRQATATHRQAAVAGWPLDGNETDHNLLYVLTPVWNENSDPTKSPGEIDGFVLGVFRVYTIVEASLSLFPPTGIDLYLTGLMDASGKMPVHAHLSPRRGDNSDAQPPNASSPIPEGGMHQTDTIDVANNRCTVVCVPSQDYLLQHRTWAPLSALLAGLVITGLLIGYLLLLTGRTQHIERLVAERTRELGESEQRFRRLIDNAGDAFFLRNEQGTILDVNQRACDSLGYTREELLSMSVADLDVNYVPQNLMRHSKYPIEDYPVSFEGVHRRKDGVTFPVEIRLTAIDFGGHRLFLSLARDITDRKRTEEALHREQRLLRDMLDLHERDRKLVAYEIHDGLAQQLTAALYRFQSVDLLRERDPIEARETFDEGLRLLREAMVETRRLISGLRPPVLDELGVVAAIECLIGEQQHNGCPKIEFIHDPKLDRLATPLESSVFRIVQECLTNACRYSKSEKVRVELGQSEGRLRIEVRDWGVGFDPNKVEGGHYGLRGIHERARLLDGDVTVQTAPQQGTRITVDLPLIVQSDNGTV